MDAPSHYFDRQPQSPSHPHTVVARVREREFTFIADAGVFAKDHLDPGTALLINTVTVRPGEKLLDVGCGYGAIGVVLAGTAGADVAFVDINWRAARLAARNCEHVGVSANVVCGDLSTAFRECWFQHAVSNPPIRAGNAVLRRLALDCYRVLQPAGCVWLVVRTKQGADSLARMLCDIFGNVETVGRKSGYKVLRSRKMPVAPVPAE